MKQMDRKIGAQLYTLRDFCQTEADLEKTLARLRQIGYKRIQISGVGPIPAKTLRRLADSFGMDIVCTHRPFAEFTDSLDELITYHHTLGCPIAGLGSMPPEYTEDLNSLKAFLAKINEIAKALRENGLCFGYHNHAFEFARFEGKWILDYLLEETDPEALCFIPDTYWMAFAGVNPADYLKKMGPRARVVHFKDLKVADRSSVTFTEILEGNLDWASIFQACDAAGAGCAVVEQDTCPGDPFDSLRLSYENLKEKGFY